MENLEFVNERIKEVMGGESPRWKKKGRVYSGMVKKFFGKIRALRDRGFSYIQICRGFEKAGLLEADSSPDALRQAFARESARRDRESELLREIRDMVSAGDQTMEAKPMKEVRRNPGAGGLGHESRPASDAEEKERVKNILGLKAVDMGTGKITKNPDGTFDYD